MSIYNASAYILSAYPFSSEFASEVERIAGPGAHFLRVGELRKKSILGMIRFARTLNRNAIFYIPLEDPESHAILPLLLGLAVLCSARKMVVIGKDGSVRSLARSDAAAALLHAGLATVAGIMAVIRSEVIVRWLMFRRRKDYPASDEARKIFYLNTVHWFGMRAGGSVGHIAGVANGFSDIGYEVDFACTK